MENEQPRINGPVIADPGQRDIYYAYATGVAQNIALDGTMASNGLVIQAKNADDETIHVILHQHDVGKLIEVAVHAGVLHAEIMHIGEDGE